MITKDELKNRIDFSFFCAESSFMKDGSFIPMIDISFKNAKGETTRAVVAVTGKAVEDRLKILYSLGVIFGNYKNQGKVLEVENVLFMTEAWASTHDKDTDMNKVPMPSQDPKKTEVLICTGRLEDGSVLMKGKKINRIMGKDGFGVELVDLGEGYSSMQDNLLVKFYDGYKNVVSKGTIFKDEDMPLGGQLKGLFN